MKNKNKKSRSTKIYHSEFFTCRFYICKKKSQLTTLLCLWFISMTKYQSVNLIQFTYIDMKIDVVSTPTKINVVRLQ